MPQPYGHTRTCPSNLSVDHRLQQTHQGRASVENVEEDVDDLVCFVRGTHLTDS